MHKEQAQRLADTLAGLRRRQRLSQRELAELSGLSRAIISILERAHDPSTGQPPNPRPDTLRRLAHGLATDGDGAHDPEADDRYYLELMVAAGHIAPGYRPAPPDRSWTLRGALRGRLPEYLIDEIVEERANDPLEDQQAAAIDLIGEYEKFIAEANAAMLARSRRRDRPA